MMVLLVPGYLATALFMILNHIYNDTVGTRGPLKILSQLADFESWTLSQFNGLFNGADSFP